MRNWGGRGLCIVAGLAATAVLASSGASGSTFVNWRGYLHDPAHSSTNKSATAITTAKVATLHAAWTFTPAPATLPGQPAAGFVSGPVVWNGMVFIGATTGILYALNESTGKVVWQQFVGFQPKITCRARGINSTVTVANDPVTLRATVYLAAPDGYLYALDALTGTVNWKSVVNIPSTTTNDYYAWSSPTVSGGRVFVGSASNCDKPLVQGSLQSYSQATGAHLATFYVVPSGAVGGGIWTTAAVRGSSVWVTTGNADPAGAQPGYSNSIVRLNAATLAVQDSWTVPGITNLDLDIGASPALFTATVAGVATPMVGACDKNGVFYAWRAQNLKAGPIWSRTVGNSDSGFDFCLAAATWDAAGSRLFHASNSTTIGTQAYPASLRRLDPATGTPVWELGLPSGPVFGSTSLNGSNVIAVVTYSTTTLPSDLFFVDAGSGAILRTIALDAATFAQPAFADHYAFVATGLDLTAWTP